MSLMISTLSNGIKFLKVSRSAQNLGLLTVVQQTPDIHQHRHINKHFNPKWKKMRREKVVKVELPNINEKFGDLTPDEQRSRMKERGVAPPRPYMERPFYISCTGGTFEPYVPPEGDGKVSSVKGVAKAKFEFLEKKGKSMMAVRKIRGFEEEFEPPEFALKAQEIYIKAHEAMMNKDKYELRKYVTERAYPEMRHNVANKTIRWKFLKSLEQPYVIHARCTDVISKENVYGQVTVRFHTQQCLAIYDRFGRLMHGSEILAKDVLEYVVFEKHLSNYHGVWRIHDKIIPDWAPPIEPSNKTYIDVIEEPEPLELMAEEKPSENIDVSVK
ncbi:CLUMA_CG013102, isoform A [Clunio marinus]|uniref:Large ribosomal subunit protein mL45 n=1 Tax=Clunio marinus TaxID=568069 RepID=A0A1J1IJ52_9DIPT|nr:CLUMA_CG013102, isoform A [Clunio marinus]